MGRERSEETRSWRSWREESVQTRMGWIGEEWRKDVLVVKTSVEALPAVPSPRGERAERAERAEGAKEERGERRRGKVPRWEEHGWVGDLATWGQGTRAEGRGVCSVGWEDDRGGLMHSAPRAVCIFRVLHRKLFRVVSLFLWIPTDSRPDDMPFTSEGTQSSHVDLLPIVLLAALAAHSTAVMGAVCNLMFLIVV
jgi:hypothetical protein